MPKLNCMCKIQFNLGIFLLNNVVFILEQQQDLLSLPYSQFLKQFS